MTAYNPYQSQSPGAAYTRWLAEGAGSGASFSIRQMLEARGRRQAALAPLFGYGIDQSIGGQGKDFAPFYSSQGGQVPSRSDVQAKLQELRRALSSGPQATPYQLALAGAYQAPSNQLEALQAGFAAQVPAALRPSLMRSTARRFNIQQATRPDQMFLDYASKEGWF